MKSLLFVSMMSMSLSACMPSTEFVGTSSPGKNGHSVLSTSGVATTTECPKLTGGTRVDFYLDVDDSLTVDTSVDTYLNSIVTCNEKHGCVHYFNHFGWYFHRNCK